MSVSVHPLPSPVPPPTRPQGRHFPLLDALMRCLSVEQVVVTGGDGFGLGTGSIHYDNLPEGVSSEYVSRTLFRADPVVAAARQGDGIVMPAEIEAIAATGFGADAMAFRREHGLIMPIILIVHERGMAVGAVTVARSTPFLPHEVEILRALGPIVHAEIVASVRPRRPVPELSARVRDCLQWAANGKTSAEIGTIIGISEHTVDHYLKTAATRLHTPTRISTIAEALRLGLIH